MDGKTIFNDGPRWRGKEQASSAWHNGSTSTIDPFASPRLRGSGDCLVPPPSDHVTNPRFIFLREIGADCLKPFLDAEIKANITGNVNNSHYGATLVIDDIVELATPLTIPAHFTLAGVGINGRGRLRFKDLGGQPALQIQNAESAFYVPLPWEPNDESLFAFV